MSLEGLVVELEGIVGGCFFVVGVVLLSIYLFCCALLNVYSALR